MTRINCIDPTELYNEHLLAEYRKLPRIFSWIENVLEKGKEPIIPRKYCSGKGHMAFFANKLLYLNNRHAEIVQELIKRKFNITFTEKLCWVHIGIPPKYWNDWMPTQEAMAINRAQINSRLLQRKGRIK